MISHRSDLPVLLVSLFNSHDFVNPYGIGFDIEEQSIFHRDVYTPAGFAGMKFLDIARCIRMIGQPLNMFANNPTVFFGKCPYELFHTCFDKDPHSASGSEPEILLCLFPGNEIAVCVCLVEVPFQHPLLVFGDEISNGITK